MIAASFRVEMWTPPKFSHQQHKSRLQKPPLLEILQTPINKDTPAKSKKQRKDDDA